MEEALTQGNPEGGNNVLGGDASLPTPAKEKKKRQEEKEKAVPDYIPEEDHLVKFPTSRYILQDYELGVLMSGNWEKRRVVYTGKLHHPLYLLFLSLRPVNSESQRAGVGKGLYRSKTMPACHGRNVVAGMQWSNHGHGRAMPLLTRHSHGRVNHMMGETP